MRKKINEKRIKMIVDEVIMKEIKKKQKKKKECFLLTPDMNLGVESF